MSLGVIRVDCAVSLGCRLQGGKPPRASPQAAKATRPLTACCGRYHEESVRSSWVWNAESGAQHHPGQERSGRSPPSYGCGNDPAAKSGLRYSAGRAPRGCGRFLPLMFRCGPASAARARPWDSIEGQCRPAGRLVPRQEPSSDITISRQAIGASRATAGGYSKINMAARGKSGSGAERETDPEGVAGVHPAQVFRLPGAYVSTLRSAQAPRHVTRHVLYWPILLKKSASRSRCIEPLD